MMIYIVYSYKASYSIPTKYIEGIYNSKEDAVKRQQIICGDDSIEGFNGSLSGNGRVAFINVVPYGDCHLELFTTTPP
jgi:hypothetical protein